MGERKRIWPSPLIVVANDPEPELSRKDRRLLDADVRYWKDSSKRKDKDIILLNNTIRGLKSHITRLQAALHRKGVYRS